MPWVRHSLEVRTTKKGRPVDWLVTAPIPAEPLKAALERDEGAGQVTDDHALLRGPRSHLEMNILYAVFGAEAQGLHVPLDGTSIMTYYMGCLPTSRGSENWAAPLSFIPEAPLLWGKC